jgi:hypothetical protein
VAIAKSIRLAITNVAKQDQSERGFDNQPEVAPTRSNRLLVTPAATTARGSTGEATSDARSVDLRTQIWCGLMPKSGLDSSVVVSPNRITPGSIPALVLDPVQFRS